MSLQIKASRAASQGGVSFQNVRGGDPGLFGFLGKAAGTILGTAGKILPGPVGAIAGTIGGALAGKKTARPSQPGTGVAISPRMPILTQARPQQRPPAPINIPGPLGGPGAGFPSPFARGGRVSIGEQQAMNGNGGPAPSGFHWNKSDYFLRDGTFVAKGTKLVKNRRRNPLNPRALDRAIGRISSAKKASKKLSRVTVRKKKC